MRPNWGDYFMLLAKMVASRSTCNSRPVGCVLVKDKQVLSTGYNGAVSQAKHCSQIGGEGYCVRRDKEATVDAKQNVCLASHAEITALALAAKKGISVDGSTLYITLNPCMVCLKTLKIAGVSSIIYELEYDFNTVKDFDKMVQNMGFNYCFKMKLSQETIDMVKTFLDSPTSYRRLKAEKMDGRNS